jgi:hypothetical protein
MGHVVGRLGGEALFFLLWRRVRTVGGQKSACCRNVSVSTCVMV